jgi:DNA-binding transcriptional LysR family regulator
MDRIELMQLFVRIHETRSFSQAARELGTTQPTVSKRLQALESSLGARLFERNTRGLRPTDAGNLYYERAKRWLAEMEDVQDQLAATRKAARGRLRLSVPVNLGQVQLTRIALAFQRQHPGVQLELSLSDRYVDLVSEGVDVAIRIGKVGSPEVVARKLASYRPIIVAAPSYIERRGVPTSFDELLSQRILYHGTRDEALFHRARSQIVPRDRELAISDALGLREAVREGIAIGMLSPWLVERDLARGTLVRILPEVYGEEFDVHALYLPTRSLPARTRAFIGYCAAEVPRIAGMHQPRPADDAAHSGGE